MQRNNVPLGIVIAVVACIAILGCTAGVGEKNDNFLDTTWQRPPLHAKLISRGNDNFANAPEDTILKQLSGKERETQRKRLQEESAGFLGQFSRGDLNEYFEFYLAPKSDIRLLRGRYAGTGEYSYSFALTSMHVFDDGTISFKVKGRRYCAERIGDSLAVLYPNGMIRYCPMIPAVQIARSD